VRRLLVAIVLAAILGSAVWPAAAQRGPVYCNVTEIKSEQLSNGVRVTIVTDGQVQWDWDFEQMIADGSIIEVTEPWGTYYTLSGTFRRLPLRLVNAKSMLGSGFVNIGKYPVSHVELSVPGWAKEGVGLEITVVNYLDWRTGEGQRQHWRYSFDLTQGEDGNSIVVLWFSDRFPPPPPAKTPEDLPSELEVAGSGGRLNLRAVNARLTEVTDAISRETGLPLTCAVDSDLRVSAHLQQVQPEEAIRALSVGLGLGVGKTPDGGYVLAEGVEKAAGYGASARRTIPLHHLRAGEALDLLPNFLLGYMHPDEESNALVVAGPEWMLERVASDLARLDTPAPQVSVDVTVVEYTSAAALQQAISAGGLLGDWGVAVDTIAGELGFLRLEGLPRGWEALLQAKEAESATRLRSKATVNVGNGSVARIFAGQQRNIVIETLERGTTAEVLPVDIGTSLQVQPLMGEGEEVLLYLSAEAHTQAGADPVSGLPVIALRRAESTMRVRDGETVLVAGLRVNQEGEQRRGIPVLRDLPLLGSLFEARDRSRSETQLAVFLTPHVSHRRLAEQGDSHDG
jgi:hypothetical protein